VGASGQPIQTAGMASSSGNDLALAAPGRTGTAKAGQPLIARYAPHDDVFPLRLPGTLAVRRSQLTTEPTYSTASPALCVVAQGAKVVMLGHEMLEYDPAHVLVFAVDLPVSSQVTRASRRDPYLGFVLYLDPARVQNSRCACTRVASPRRPTIVGSTSGATDGIVDAVTCLLDLMAQAEDAELARTAGGRRNSDSSAPHVYWP
jgi:AraC-type transcriptional regulator N-terminus